MISFLVEKPLLMSLFFSVVVNIFFFLIALIFRTDKVTDLSYSLSFVLLAPALLFSKGAGFSMGQILFTIAIVLWGIRLGSYLLMRILKTKTDHRFDDKRNNPINLIKFWGLQIIAVCVIMLPVSFFLTSRSVGAINIFSYVGFTLFILGLIIEWFSDAQKFSFKNKPENRGRWIDSGLWHYSRHPNYFGEIMLWWGLFIVTLPTLSGWMFLTLLGPIFITVLLLFVSGIPLLEKSSEKRYGANPKYMKYKKNTSILIPLPKKRRI